MRQYVESASAAFNTARRFRFSSSMGMAAANTCEVLLPLVRGIGLARLLTPEQFGIAVSITVTAGILELISDLGVSQLAVKFGNTVRLHTLHTVALLRGLIIGCVIIFASPLFSLLFHTHGLGWIYAIVGIASIIRGMTHLELKANMRHHDYRGEALNSLCGQAVWTPVTLVSAAIWHDYRAMAFGLVASVTANVILSHFIAKKSWRLGWDRATLHESFVYGGPLAFNGMAFALTSLGDRTITGAKIGLVQLAHYSALTTSAFLPRSAILKYLNSIFLTQFVNSQERELQSHVGSTWLIVVSTVSGIFGVLYFSFGQLATKLVFGGAYNISQTVVSMIALLGTIRYMAGLPTPPALALGHTGTLVRSTFLSTSGLGLGALLLLIAPRLDLLVLGLSVGEAIALFWVTLKVCEFLNMDIRVTFVAVAGPILIMCILASATYLLGSQSLWQHLALSLCGATAQTILTIYALRATNITFSEAIRCAFPSRTPHRVVDHQATK